MKCVIYITCHDEISKSKAQHVKRVIECNNSGNIAHVLFLGPSMFFENQAYKVIKMNYCQWKDADYVGMFSYAIFDKCSCDDIGQALSSIPQEAEVASFVNVKMHVNGTELDMYEAATLVHGRNFLISWDTLLQAVGAPYPTIYRQISKPFYCNCFVARPRVFSMYMDFNIHCQEVVLSNDELRHVMLLPVEYAAGNLSIRQLKTVFGVPYWASVPFVMERLAPWFMQEFNVYHATPETCVYGKKTCNIVDIKWCSM